MNNKIVQRKQNSFISPKHRNTLSFGNDLLQKIDSPRDLSGCTSLQSLKSSSLHLRKLIKSPQAHSARQQDFSELLLSKRSSITSMMQIFSENLNVISSSEPFENIESIRHLPIENVAIQQIDDIQQENYLNLLELKPDCYNSMQINRFRFYYCSVKIQGQESPLWVHLRCEQQRAINMRIYISTTAQFPTKFNCEAVIQSKYFKYIDRKHNEKFQDQYLYMSLYSEDDCEVQITFIYGNKLMRNKKPQREKPNYEKYKGWLSQCIEISETDKIHNNLNTQQYSRDAKKEKLSFISDQLDQRIKNARGKKKEIIEVKHIDFLSKYQANETLKEIRSQQKLQNRFKNALIRFQTQWLGFFILMHFAENIKLMIDNAKKRSKYLAKGRLIVWKYRTTTMIKIKESGSTVDQRNLFKLCMSICMFSTHKRKLSILKTGKVFYYFFKITHMYCHFLQKHKEYTYKVNYVKKVFRNLKQKEKAYRDRLWRVLNKYSHEILQTLGANYTNIKKRTYQVDGAALQKAMEDFLSHKKRKCQQFIQNYVREKDQKQRVVDLALNMMQPELFDTPSYDDLYGIFRSYAHYKRLTITH